MWQLFQFPLCPFSRKVRLVLAEKGVAAELVRENPWERRDEFVDLNPAGETPVMVEADPGDVVVFSSRMLHMTTPNTTDAVRWAYVLEYMRLADVDPFVPGRRFVAARGGRSAPAFVDALASERSVRNRVR